MRPLARAVPPLLPLAAAVTVSAPARAATGPFDTAPAKAVIARLAPRYADQTVFGAPPPSGAATFEIGGTTGHVLLSGSSPTAITAAFDHYLRHVAHGQ